VWFNNSLAISAKTKLKRVRRRGRSAGRIQAAVLTYVNSGRPAKPMRRYVQRPVRACKGATITSLNVSVVNTAATSSAAASLTRPFSYTATLTSLAPGIRYIFYNGKRTRPRLVTAGLHQFYLLLDDSPSMGIGANPSISRPCRTPTMAAPSRATRRTPSQPQLSRLYGANVPGTQLRIDAMRNATSQLVSTAIAQTVVPNQFKSASNLRQQCHHGRRADHEPAQVQTHCLPSCCR